MSEKTSDPDSSAPVLSDKSERHSDIVVASEPHIGVSRFHELRYNWTRGAAYQRHCPNHTESRIPIVERDYEKLLDCIVNCTEFEERVPLPVLVDIINDLWEADGLFE